MIRFAQPDTSICWRSSRLLGLLFWLCAGCAARAWNASATSPMLERLSDAAGNAKRMAKVVLILLAVGLIVVGLANPQIGTRMEEVKQEGIDLFIALDVSLSMKAEDIKPNRLEKAKLEIRNPDRPAGRRPDRPDRVRGRGVHAVPADDRLQRGESLPGCGRRGCRAGARHEHRRGHRTRGGIVRFRGADDEGRS